MQVQSIVQRALGRRSIPAGLREPPELSGSLPVLGHTIEFVRSTIELLFRAHAELGEVAATQIAHKRMVAVFGPEAHEAVFRAPDSLLSPTEAYKIMTPVFGKGMVYDAPPDIMTEQLKMLLPALKDRRMRTYGEIIVREVESAIADWGDEGVIDFVDFCRVLTNYTSATCLIGPEFREGMTEEFARVYHDLERGVTPIAYLNAHLPLPSFRRRDRARVRLEAMITSIVEERRRAGRTGEDFLQTLMDAKYKSGAALTEYEITGMLLAAMFAGHHTSSVTTAWTMLELLQNRSCLDSVREELDAVFGGGEEVSFQTLRLLARTEGAVKEALRMHPPLFMLVRTVMQDWSYKGYYLPAGTWLLISPTVTHRMPELFSDPDRFDPERFLPPREEDKRDFAYIPFGGGRHKCMGNAFAFLQIKAILAILLRRYDFELVGDTVGSDFHGLVVGPTEPCRFRYRLRSESSVRAGARPKANGQSRPAARSFRVLTDGDLCQGHAVCMGEAPEVFRVSGLGKVELRCERPDPSLRPKVELAAKFCPTGSIKIVED